MIYQAFKQCAFKLDPELAHELSLQALSRFPKSIAFSFQQNLDIQSDRYQVKLGPKLSWPYPVGLAAGLDKNAQAISFFSRLYLGAIEVGTVTPLAQAGNPKPRLFRYPEYEGLRNCMGFNNAGADSVEEMIKQQNRNSRALGINLGKNKVTPQELAHEDYLKLYRKFAALADYLVINISSPNTPGLRDLQAKKGFTEILQALKEERKERPCPLFVKIAPDLSFDDVSALLELAIDYRLDGVIATNTTKKPEWGDGGVSGKPLLEKSKKMREFVLREIKNTPDFHCIGVGGVSSFDDVWDFWKAGGKALQIYTAFIYQGPELFKSIKKGIDQKLQKHNFDKLEDLLTQINDL